MKIAFVVAMARNRAIGLNNQMPWYLPDELQYFKRVTMGKPVVMGRNTFESIGRPLPGRPNIVITRNADYAAAGITVVNSLAAALETAQALLTPEQQEVMVIGGGQVFSEALPLADRLYLTVVDAEPLADAFFPEFDRSLWHETLRESHAANEKNLFAYCVMVLNKK